MPDWALQFVWNQPEVAVALSGMSTMQHVIDNIESAENSGIGILSKEELTTIENLRMAFESYDIVRCTNCSYYMPCPNGVSIPMNLEFLNEMAYLGEIAGKVLFFYDSFAKTEKEYKNRKMAGEDVDGAAGLCTECGECIEKCPQGIEIPEQLKKLHAIVIEKKPMKEVLPDI